MLLFFSIKKTEPILFQKQNKKKQQTLQTGITNNQPRHVIEISPDKDTDLLCWSVQRDTRGLEKNDPRNFTAFLGLDVLTMNGDKYESIANAKFRQTTISVAYESDDDFDGYIQLKGGKKYYVVFRGYPREAREAAKEVDATLAMMTSNPVNTRILLNQSSFNLEKAFKYVGFPELNFEDGNDVSNSVPCQINKQDAENVPWSNIASYPIKPLK